MKPITLYNGAAGLNTVLDPQRLSQGGKDAPGIIDFAQAVNVSIDDRGLTTLREGYGSGLAGSFHSLFCDGGDCFAVQERELDAALVQVTSLSPLAVSLVRTGLTKNIHMSFCRVNTDTFYGNGAQIGYIRNGTSYVWPVGTYKGPTSDFVFSSTIPLARHIAFRPGGQMVIADGAALLINHSAFQFGLFSLRDGYIGFQSDVQMLAMVRDGFFASDAEKTWFFRKTPGQWYGYRQELADSLPAIPGTLAHDSVNMRDAGFDLPFTGRVWCNTKGVCIGADDGKVLELTRYDVEYPAHVSRGSCLVTDKKIINTTY